MNLKLFEEYFVSMMPEVSHIPYDRWAKVKLQRTEDESANVDWADSQGSA
jgi:hypothetical protein